MYHLTATYETAIERYLDSHLTGLGEEKIIMTKVVSKAEPFISHVLSIALRQWKLNI